MRSGNVGTPAGKLPIRKDQKLIAKKILLKTPIFQLKKYNSNNSLGAILHNLLVLLLITFRFHAVAFIDLLSVPAVPSYFSMFHLLPFFPCRTTNT